MIFLENFLIKTVPKLTNLCVCFLYFVISDALQLDEKKALKKEGEKEKEKEIKTNVGQFDATRWQQQSRVASRGRLPTGGNRNMKIYSKRRWQRRRSSRGVAEEKEKGGRRRCLYRQGVRQLPAHFVVRKKKELFLYVWHTCDDDDWGGQRRRAACGMWHVVSAAIECGDCVLHFLFAAAKMQNAVLMNSKLIRTICPLSAAAAEPAAAAAAH